MNKGALNLDGSQLLDLMITYEFEEEFKILFTPRIANQWKNQEVTSVSRKFEFEEEFKILFTPRIANQWKNQEVTSVSRKHIIQTK